MTESPEPGVFLSLVGNQPGSVACVALSLARQGLLKDAVLLYTSRTKGVAERLERFFNGRAELPSVVLLPIDLAVDVTEFCSVVRAQVGRSAGRPLFLNISSGPSFFWAQVARELQGLNDAAVCPLFAGFERLWVVGRQTSWPLVDLGLETLFDLHGLRPSYRRVGQAKLVADLELRSAHGRSVIRADLAYEHRGRLFCLWENVSDRNAFRKYFGLRGDRPELAGLQVHKTLVTRDYAVWQRARVNGIQAIRISPRRPEVAEWLLDRWKRFEPPQPGESSLWRGDDRCETPVQGAFSGVGGDGPPLLTCLGNDAAPTLAAVYAQRPRVAWVVYDARTPLICWLARNLARVAGQLPVGQLHLLPRADAVHGRGMTSRSLALLLADSSAILANITPGSKAQSYALGRLPSVRLCSIDQSGGSVIRALDTGDELFPGAAVPAEVLGAVQGGAGLSWRLADAELRPRRLFLWQMAQAVAGLTDSAGRFQLISAQRDGIGLEVSRANRHYAVRVVKDGVSRRGGLPTVRGDWFEDVAAGAFFAAGARGLRVGMAWPWPNQRAEDKDIHRTEIDIVFPWRTHHVVVSVKGCGLKGGGELRAKCEEVRAMALECFGRLSLPVLVYFRPPEQCHAERSLADLERYRVLVLGAVQLADSAGLRALIDQAFDRLRSF